MAAFELSRRAEGGLLDIAHYTLRTWGQEQALRYLGELEDCCRRVANRPGLGRACDEIRPGLKRMEHGRHVVFYRPAPSGIFVCRILHQRMLPQRHPIED